MRSGAVVVEFLDRSGAFPGKGLGTRESPLRGVQFALALLHDGLQGGRVAPAYGDLRLGARDGIDGLPVAGARLVALRVEYIDLHLRERLAGLYEISFVDHDVLHPPRKLGRNIDLGGLDAAITADEA